MGGALNASLVLLGLGLDAGGGGGDLDDPDGARFPARLAANWTHCRNGSDEDAVLPYSSRPETYFLPVLFAGIYLTGVLGNGTLIFMFVSDRKMRNEPNTFIFSLALGDLLLILVAVPFVWVIYALPSWPFGLLLCKLLETVKDVSVGVSVFTLTALSAARCFPIVDPMRARSSPAKCTAATCSAAIWVLAVALATPAAINSHLLSVSGVNQTECGETGEGSYCFPFAEHWRCPMTAIHCVVYYAVPLLAIFVFYALMACRLFQSAASLPGEQHGHGPARTRQVKARRKVARTVLAFVLVYWVCFTPHQIFALWFHCHPGAERDYGAGWHYFRIFAFCLKFLNSCVNPIALYCVSGVFRKKFQRYLGWLVRGGRRRRASTSLLTSSGTLPPARRASRPRAAQRTAAARRQGTRSTLVTTFMNGNGVPPT
ncbi:hypothetical protein ONE63_003067 [Megalurothrips usitatus]|uniref:G-protein coupled receptors family 1 profile domain-containing protein n=1 Tax=Megalurothrips usitatus TaxID=439358 RepID=A0AAV7XAJ9_9NEOP|nr:hypothetical protein ONE63_003067 [Megalurothrips usitatus]